MGERKSNPTVHDIAKQLNVAASTVSRALNDHPKISQATKDRVKEMALSLGYAQNISSNLRQELIGKTVGLILPNLGDSKYNLMFESCRKRIEEYGYQVMVCCSSDDGAKEQQLVRLLENVGVNGMIASISKENKNYKYLQRFAQNKPLVLFDRISFEIPCDKVMIDHFQAGFRAVQHFLNMGCRKIIHLGGNINDPLTKQISTGFKTAARNGKIDLDSQSELFSNDLYGDVVQAVDMIFSGSKMPDAILIDDILAAQRLVSVLLTRKIEIPKDVAIIAIGDEGDYSYYSPSITTIQLPYAKMGRKAADLLLGQLNKEGPIANPETVVIPFDLNIRNSTLKT